MGGWAQTPIQQRYDHRAFSSLLSYLESFRSTCNPFSFPFLHFSAFGSVFSEVSGHPDKNVHVYQQHSNSTAEVVNVTSTPPKVPTRRATTSMWCLFIACLSVVCAFTSLILRELTGLHCLSNYSRKWATVVYYRVTLHDVNIFAPYETRFD